MKRILLLNIILVSAIIFTNCTSSKFMNVDVTRSPFIDDDYVLNRDSIIVGCIRIASEAQRHYYKPFSLDGGGNSFERYLIPHYLMETSSGYYSFKRRLNNKILIVGAGKEIGYDGTNPTEVEVIISPDKIESVCILN